MNLLPGSISNVGNDRVHSILRTHAGGSDGLIRTVEIFVDRFLVTGVLRVSGAPGAL